MIIAPIVVMFLSGVQFDAQTVPGLRIGETDPLSGLTEAYFYGADANADGLLDLVVPDRVYFQQNGRFGINAAVPLPVRGVPAQCDVFENMLFFRLRNRLEAFTWRAEGWKMVIGQNIEWPDGFARDAPQDRDTPDHAIALFRFLHDFNEDGIPEVVVPAPDGLHIIAKIGDEYIATARLEIYPNAQAIHAAGIAIWPPEKRALLFPPREKRFTLSLHRDTVTVGIRRAAGSRTADYEFATYRVDSNKNFTVAAGIPETIKFEHIPQALQPCRLNGDATLDFAGGEMSYTQAAALPNPIYDTFASTDAGATVQRIRTHTFAPKVSFEDFDGDGDADMIVEASGMLTGGVRESLNRFMFHRSIDHEVRVHFQNALGEFSAQPDRRFAVRIHLEKPPYHFQKQYARYLSGETIDISGDFDGDGYKDLVARERPDRLSVYFSRSANGDRVPVQTLPIDAERHFGVADVDGDGRHDIVVQSENASAAPPDSDTLVYFARARK